MCVSVDGYLYMTAGAIVAKGEGARSPGPGVTDDCEEPDMDAGNLTWVFCNSSVCF